MLQHKKILSLIDEISKANPIMEDIFLYGSCCNFHFILKSVFPEAKAHFNIAHVITQIGDKYYDITGEINTNDVLKNRYLPIGEIYAYKYKTDESIKSGLMYDPIKKDKYLRDRSKFTELCKKKKCLCKFDDGTQIPFHHKNHPPPKPPMRKSNFHQQLDDAMTKANAKREPTDFENKKCWCGNEEIEKHTCPYQEDVNGDSEYLCNCCDSCEQNCCDDI